MSKADILKSFIPNPDEPELFPVLFKLAGKRALVIGGGPVAARKAESLLRAGARVRAVAPEWGAEFAALAGRPGLRRVTGRFVPRQLDGIFIAIAATDDIRVQKFAAREAAKRNIPLNVADVPALSDFYLPATLRQGALSVSVSSSGHSPLLAVRVRDRLRELISPALGAALPRLALARRVARARQPDPAKRGAALERLLTPEIVAELIAGRTQPFEKALLSWHA
jgi:siroheme synthase-like protein